MDEYGKKGIALPALIALVVSSAIGAGIYDLPATLAVNATPGVALVAWLITGTGILLLAWNLNYVVLNKPELNGIADYARAGFGDFAGFVSGWGYWLSGWLGNIAFATMMMSAVGYFIPSFKSGNSIEAIIFASIISWFLTWIVSRGIESAAILNLIVTITKLIPILAFMVMIVISFKSGIFTTHFWANVSVNTDGGKIFFSTATTGGVIKQIQGSIMAMMWVFVGIEGATMLADRAKRKSDAGKATIIGVLALLVIYIIISILPFGYLSQAELVKLPHPAVVYIFKQMLGPVGGAFISLGLMISIFGAWLSWTMLPVESTSLMAKQGLLPKWFGTLNKYEAPAHALYITQILMQLFLITLVFTDQAYNFAFSMSTSAIIITYSFVGAYMVKLGWQQKQFSVFLPGFLSAAFELSAIIFVGLQYLWLATIIYVLGFIFYYLARKRAGKNIKPIEMALMLIITIVAALALYALISGQVSL